MSAQLNCLSSDNISMPERKQHCLHVAQPSKSSCIMHPCSLAATFGQTDLQQSAKQLALALCNSYLLMTAPAGNLDLPCIVNIDSALHTQI